MRRRAIGAARVSAAAGASRAAWVSREPASSGEDDVLLLARGDRGAAAQGAREEGTTAAERGPRRGKRLEGHG